MIKNKRKDRTERLKSIVTFLSDEDKNTPRKFGEIKEHIQKKKFKVAQRFLEYDLELLVEIGRISRDTPSKGFYSIPGPRIMSEGDYKLARSHARVLLFSKARRQSIDQINEKKWLEELPRYQYGDLLSHLRTGYVEDFYSIYEEYLKSKLRNDQQSAKELEKQLIESLRLIMHRVKSKNILKGFCNSCPPSEVRIANE